MVLNNIINLNFTYNVYHITFRAFFTGATVHCGSADCFGVHNWNIMFYSSRSCMQFVALCHFYNGHTAGCFVVFFRVRLGLLKRLLFVLLDLNEMVDLLS